MFLRMIFYLCICVALFGVLSYFNLEESKTFFQHIDLWQDPMLAAALGGLLSALLGAFLIMRRVVFLSLAVTQSGGMGIFFGFIMGMLLGWQDVPHGLLLVMGVLFALLPLLSLGLMRKSRKFKDENWIAIIYVLTSAVILLIGDRIVQEKHEIDTILFGSAVATTSAELYQLLAVTLVVLFILYVFRWHFIYFIVDETFLTVAKKNVRAIYILLYFTLGLGITFAIHALGSLPVFAMMVLIPVMALQTASNLKAMVMVLLLVGICTGPLGYYFSYLYSFPTGASMVLIAFVILLLSQLERLFKK